MATPQNGAWHSDSLGNLVNFTTGKLNSNAAVADGRYPFFTCSQETLRTNTFSFDAECVLLAGNNANGIYPLKYFKGQFDAYQRTYIITPKNRRRLNTHFLYYAIRPMLEHLKSISTGAATKFLTLTILNGRTLQVPPLPTQAKIASILSAYDDLIENNTRRIAILEAMAQAIYREWFVEFRFPGHEKFKLVNSPLGKIPEGWKLRPLGEVAVITMGTSPKGDTYNEEGDGTPLVNGPVEFGERFTKQVKWTTAPSRYCKEGDLVVCVRGSTTGKYVRSDGVYCLGRGVCGLSSKHQYFVNLLFANEKNALLAQTGGSTFPSWTGPQLKLHPVMSPPDELLERFEELVKPMSVAVLVYSRQMQNLRKTRDLLLPRLISGELDVKNLDIETDEAELLAV
jgi:type I restriction enzyme S subunit